MSLVNRDGRLSVKPFASVPALLDLPQILRKPATVSNVSSLSSIRGGIQLEEGCLITKSIKYTHQVAHLLNAVRSGDPKPIVSLKFQKDFNRNRRNLSLQHDLVISLRIIPYARFTLNDPCNLVLRKSEGLSCTG